MSEYVQSDSESQEIRAQGLRLREQGLEFRKNHHAWPYARIQSEMRAISGCGGKSCEPDFLVLKSSVCCDQHTI